MNSPRCLFIMIFMIMSWHWKLKPLAGNHYSLTLETGDVISNSFSSFTVTDVTAECLIHWVYAGGRNWQTLCSGLLPAVLISLTVMDQMFCSWSHFLSLSTRTQLPSGISTGLRTQPLQTNIFFCLNHYVVEPLGFRVVLLHLFL